MRARNLAESMRYAVEGLEHGFRNERNLRLHFCSAAIALILGAAFKVSPGEYAALVLAASIVITVEMLNTAIEACVDLETSEDRPLAKIAKNVAAGAVLVAAMGAVLVGLIVFLPRVIVLLVGA